MSLVLDSSVAIAWVYSEEATDAVRDVFDRLIRGGAWVPSLWRVEVANVLEVAFRKGRHNLVFINSTLTDLGLCPIRLDSETDQRAWNTTLQLARRYRLTVYDATYLELAQRRGLPLATLDRDLRTAATAEHIPLLGL